MPTTVIVGGGQAGLAAAYQLQLQDPEHDYVVLEANDAIGRQWEQRWDSLKLFSPAKFSLLAGSDEVPLADGDLSTFATKDEVAEYLRAYADHHKLNVRLNARVDRIEHKSGSSWLVHLEAAEGEDTETLEAQHVVLATGGFPKARLPHWTDELDKAGVPWLHSSQYHNPSDIPTAGSVVVVGVGASGVQIASDLLEAAKDTHAEVSLYVAGRDVGSMPRSILGVDIYSILNSTGMLAMKKDSWMGKKVIADSFDLGDILVGTSLSEIVRQGATHIDMRAIGCLVEENDKGTLCFSADRDAEKRLASYDSVDERADTLAAETQNQIQDVACVVFATGFQPDFGSILDVDSLQLDDEVLLFDDHGYPRQTDGTVDVSGAEGLHFLGLRWMRTAASSQLCGCSDDAAVVAARIVSQSNS